MIHLIATKMACNISARLGYDEEKRQWLSYGIETRLHKIVCLSCILVVALWTSCVPEAVIFISFFITLRKYSGGYHIPVSFLCIFSSVLLCFFSIYCSSFFSGVISSEFCLFLTFISAIIISAFSPINHPNLHLTCSEASKLRIKSRITVTIQIVILIAAVFVSISSRYVFIGSAAINSVAALMILSKILAPEVIDHESEEETQR